MAGMKGISPLVSYVLAILLAVIVVAAVAVLVNGFYQTLLQDEIKRELTQAAAQTSSKVTELYSVGKASKAVPATSTAILLAEDSINLPQQVASRNYEISFLTGNQVSSSVSNVTVNGQNASTINSAAVGKVVAQTTQDPIVRVEYEMPSIDVDLQGASGNPGNTTIRFYRYNPNGTVIDTIVVGDYSLLGQVGVVS